MKDITLNQVKSDIASAMDLLSGAEGVGICGSLARGEFTEKSDIDIFVVLNQRELSEKDHRFWITLIRKVLDDYDREISVVIYTISGLVKISNWYVLRLATEGILAYDRAGRVETLFKKILDEAKKAGLIQKEIGGRKVWTKEPIRIGEVFKVELDEQY